jgi:hypothetical protein
MTAGRFAGTTAALLGSKAHRAELRFVAFDLPILAGVDLQSIPGRSDGSGSNWWPRRSTRH